MYGPKHTDKVAHTTIMLLRISNYNTMPRSINEIQ
jgi:hypothetical protein